MKTVKTKIGKGFQTYEFSKDKRYLVKLPKNAISEQNAKELQEFFDKEGLRVVLLLTANE
jgi:hypothetical protein